MKKIVLIALLMTPAGITFASPASAQSWGPSANVCMRNPAACPPSSAGYYGGGYGYDNYNSYDAPIVISYKMRRGDVCYDAKGIPYSYLGKGHFERFPGATPLDASQLSPDMMCGRNRYNANRR